MLRVCAQHDDDALSCMALGTSGSVQVGSRLKGNCNIVYSTMSTQHIIDLIAMTEMSVFIVVELTQTCAQTQLPQSCQQSKAKQSKAKSLLEGPAGSRAKDNKFSE